MCKYTYCLLAENTIICRFTGVLLTAVCLITEMCEKSPDTLEHFRKVWNKIVLQWLAKLGTPAARLSHICIKLGYQCL